MIILRLPGARATPFPVRRNRRKLRRRLPRQQTTKGIEVAFFSELVKLLEKARAILLARVLPILPELVREAQAVRGDGEHADAGRRINEEMEKVELSFWQSVSGAELEELGRRIGRATSGFQREQLNRQIRAALGVDLDRIVLGERGLEARISDFTAENVALIKSVPQRYFEEIEQRVTSGIRDGSRHEQIAEELEERYALTRKRAALIARDQVGKFYGELQESRQTQLGVVEYTWRTVRDNRVRPEHEEREGEKFRWDDPPADGHPGAAVNCRCFAEPDLSELFELL